MKGKNLVRPMRQPETKPILATASATESPLPLYFFIAEEAQTPCLCTNTSCRDRTEILDFYRTNLIIDC